LPARAAAHANYAESNQHRRAATRNKGVHDQHE
jgi:hypothetical protein